MTAYSASIAAPLIRGAERGVVVGASSWIVPLAGLAANALLAAGSYAIARYGLRQRPGLSRALAAAVIFWTGVTIGLEVLGSLGAIGVFPMLAWAAMFAVMGGLASRLARDEISSVPYAVVERSSSLDTVLCIALMLSAVLVRALPSLLLAVKVVSDGPIYHLYFAARWWKAGRLLLVAAPFGENAATYFPANGDLWFTWLIASWGGDRLARVGQAPFLLLAGAAAFGCARSIGAGRAASLFATCCFVLSTPLLLFSFEPNVDTIFVAGYLLACYFFLRAMRGERALPALLIGALAAGLALGTKPVGVAFLPPLLALVIAGILLQAAPVRTKASAMGIALLVPLLSGGFWFLRNAGITGNPLYPLAVEWRGQTLLPGWYGPDVMRTSQYYLPFRDWRAFGDILLAVLDPRLAPLWAIALVWSLVPASPNANAAARWSRVFGMMAVVNVAIYWVVIPYRTQQRFMLHAVGLAAVSLAAFLERRPWLRWLCAGLLALHVLTPQSWPLPARDDAIPWDLSPHIPNAVGSLVPLFPALEPSLRATGASDPALSVPMLVVVVSALLAAWSWSRIGSDLTRESSRIAVAAATTAAFVVLGIVVPGYGASALDPRLTFYPHTFPDFYRGWLNFDVRCGPAGSTVAYAGTNLPYYLLGRGLRNEVRYVNIDKHRDWLLHHYHREAQGHGEPVWPNARPGWDRIHPDYTAWLENLDSEGVELLVVTRLNSDAGLHNVADRERFPIERQWADAHPDRFEPLYGQREGDPWFRLYRVRRPGATGRSGVPIAITKGHRSLLRARNESPLNGLTRETALILEEGRTIWSAYAPRANRHDTVDRGAADAPNFEDAIGLARRHAGPHPGP
jgi:hypothetical protein